MTVKIVTDTGCDLPAPLIEQYDIHLAPLVLRFGEREVRDSPETRAELWRRVEAGLPCETSGPPVGPYLEVFAPLIEAGHELVCITLTGAHSVTYNSARLAAQDFPGQITVIDGRSISLGYGLQALKAAELAAAGPAERLAVAHSRAPEEAAALADELAQALNFPRPEILMVEIGSVLIAHAGQGLLGAGSIRAE